MYFLYCVSYVRLQVYFYFITFQKLFLMCLVFVTERKWIFIISMYVIHCTGPDRVSVRMLLCRLYIQIYIVLYLLPTRKVKHSSTGGASDRHRTFSAWVVCRHENVLHHWVAEILFFLFLLLQDVESFIVGKSFRQNINIFIYQYLNINSSGRLLFNKPIYLV